MPEVIHEITLNPDSVLRPQLEEKLKEYAGRRLKKIYLAPEKVAVTYAQGILSRLLDNGVVTFTEMTNYFSDEMGWLDYEEQIEWFRNYWVVIFEYVSGKRPIELRSKRD